MEDNEPQLQELLKDMQNNMIIFDSLLEHFKEISSLILEFKVIHLLDKIPSEMVDEYQRAFNEIEKNGYDTLEKVRLCNELGHITLEKMIIVEAYINNAFNSTIGMNQFVARHS